MSKQTRTPTSNKQALQDIPTGVPFQFYFGGPEVFEAGNVYKEASKGVVFRAISQIGSFDKEGTLWAVKPNMRFERPGREVVRLEQGEDGKLLELETPKISKVSR